MKMSVLALLSLLGVLIVTCVYEKTYTIYSTGTDAPKELILVKRETTAENKNTIKTDVVEKEEEKTSSILLATPKKHTETAPSPETLHEKPVIQKTKTENIPTTKKSVSIAEASVEEKATATTKSMQELIPFYQKMLEKEKALLSSKNNTPEPKSKVATTQTKKASTSKPVSTENPKAARTNKTQPTSQDSGEKEIVDYIMWALKNRDIALKNRDEVEARIQELITKALNDRKVALKERKVVIDERSKNAVTLEKMQTKLIDDRDASYESVINPIITNQGEK